MAPMSKEHKEALAKGRAQAKAVKEYLSAREAASKRGPKMTPQKLHDRIAETRRAIEEEPDPTRRVELIQQRMDDEERLEQIQDEPDMDALESRFVDVAREYSERKGISYMAWRELGVPAAVLRRAGVPRTHRTS